MFTTLNKQKKVIYAQVGPTQYQILLHTLKLTKQNVLSHLKKKQAKR